MPIKLFDRVKQKTTTAGSGPVTLGDSVDSFLDFSSVFSNGDQTFYTIEGPTIFEVGLGTYSAGTVSRDTVFKSSNSDQLVNLPGDLNTSIFVTYSASGAVYTTGDRIITDIDGITFPDGATQIIAYTGQVSDLTSYATTGYVNDASGHLQTQITSNDSDISTLQTATGNLDTRVTQNASNVSTVSGIAQGAADDVATASGHLQTQITSNDSDINTVSGIAQGAASDVATASGHLQTQITSNDSDITALQTATGNLDTRVTQNASNVTTVSGIAQGAADDVATASGHLQTQITSNDSDINTVSGIAQGAASDVATASGHLQTQITSNDSDITALQTATGNLDTRVTQNASNVTTVSGIAQGAADDVATASGHLQTQITSNDSDINTVSGIAQGAASDVATASGHLQTQITSNDSDITALQTATGNLDTRVTQNASNVTTVSGIAQGAADDVATASGHLQTQITSNDSDITALQTATGSLDTRVTQNDTDITTVSGIAQGAADDVVVVSGLLYNNWNVNVTGNTDSITSDETVIFTGLGFTSVTYDESTNTVFISGDGSESAGFDWNVSVTGLSNTIASGDTVTFTGLGLTTVTYDPSTNVISISGTEATFDDDLTVSLSDGKTFGRYPDGATIPASGKTAREVISLSIAEPINPSVSLSSPTSVAFNQTGINNTLNFSHTINSVGASVSSAVLQFRRGGVGSWTTLSTSTTTPDSFVHSFTDTNFNTSGMNYRYVVTDNLGATNTATHNINPASYSSPSISWNLVGNALSGIETNTKRERGNVNSQINGTISRNSPNVDLISYKIQYRVNGGSYVDIGSASIGPGTSSIASTGHNPVANKTANQIQYRIRVVDEYQQYLSSQVTSSTKTINFLFLIFYGAVSSAPTNSAGVRAVGTKIFTDGSNPFQLNTGSTLKDFTVAMPDTISISQVLDLDALSANITASYVNNPFNVEDAGGTNVAYNVYTMSNSVPYASNHRHEVTRS